MNILIGLVLAGMSLTAATAAVAEERHFNGVVDHISQGGRDSQGKGGSDVAMEEIVLQHERTSSNQSDGQKTIIGGFKSLSGMD